MVEPDGATENVDRELHEVEEQLARLRGERDALDEDQNDRASSRNAEDSAAAATNRAEDQAVIDLLEQRRQALRSD